MFQKQQKKTKFRFCKNCKITTVLMICPVCKKFIESAKYATNKQKSEEQFDD